MESLPLVKIGLAAVKWVWKGVAVAGSLVTLLCLGRIYAKSHSIYVKRHQLGKIHHQLGHFLEVSIQTTDMYRKTCGYEARIALRTQAYVEGIVDSAKIFIRTKGWAGRQQETLFVCKIGRQWENLKLNNMPDVDLKIVDGNILMQVREIYIDAIEVSYQKTLYTPDGSQAVILYPTYFDHMNEGWVKRWGRSYHLGHYFLGKQNLLIAMRYALVNCFEEHSYKFLTPYSYIRKAIAYIITCNFVLSLLYPLLLATGCIDLDDDGEISSRLRWISVRNVRKLLRVGDDVLEA
jgi:hypothetical protein